MRKFLIFLLTLLLLFTCACPALCEDEEEEFSFADLESAPSADPEEAADAPEGQPDNGAEAPEAPADEAPAAASGPVLQADGSILLTLTAAGDVTIGRNVQHKGTSIFDKELSKQAGDVNFIFRNVKELFENDDATIVNFEGVLADEYKIPSKKKNNDFLFLAPPEYAFVLPNNSVEIATIENNHIDDFGDEGRADTQNALTQAGTFWADEYHMAEYEAQGIKIAVLAYKTFDYYDTLRSKVPAEIASAKEDHDLVVVAFHWGAELDYAPNANQVSLAHLAVDSGADLVLGHHSHRINPIERYHDKYIVYSLANCSFAGNNKPSDMFTYIFQTRFRFRDGMIVENTFRIIPCRISSRKDYNDFAITPLTDQSNIATVMSSLKSNSKKLDYAVENYPMEWE